MRKCRAVDRPRGPIKDGIDFLAAAVQSFRTPLCEEDAVAETVLGPRCARHLEEFREAMADPNALINVKSGRGRTPQEIDAMIRFLQ